MRVDRRGVVLVLVALAAVALVGLAARVEEGSGDAALTVADDTGRAAVRLAAVLFGVLALAVLALVVLGLGGSGGGRKERKRSPIATLVLIIALLLVLSRLERPEDPAPADDTPGEEGAAPGEGEEAADEPRRSPVGTLLVAGLGLLVLVGAAGAVARSRLQRDGAVVAPEEPVLVPAGGPPAASLAAQAAAEPDPRQAVLLAFAAAEQALAPTPLARRPATSPREWLAAVRRADPAVAEPLAVVVGRYEVARFSHHDVADADRRLALDALDRLP